MSVAGARNNNSEQRLGLRETSSKNVFVPGLFAFSAATR